MSRVLLCALMMFGATPAFAGMAHTTMSVGVVVLPSEPPVQAPPAPAGTGTDTSPGH